MNPFTRQDSLIAASQSNLNKIRNRSLKDCLAEDGDAAITRNRSAISHIPTLYYFEKPENLHIINAFIKRFLAGSHINCIDAINRLNLQLMTIGLSIHDYDGESGTYPVSQYGNSGNDNPLTGSYVADDQLFLRSKLHASIGIRKIAVPGGMYELDAEIFVTKKP